MYRLKEWFLEETERGFRGRGACYDNPKFFNGKFIHTSPILRIEVENEENRLKIFTRSGNCYVLEYAYIRHYTLETTQKALEEMNIVVDLQRCIALKEERINATKKKVAKLLNPNELYVIMPSGMSIEETYFKGKDGDITKIDASVHIGTFMDSIMVADYTGLCDWRIFPSVYRVKPYHWSDNLKAVHIENVGEDFVFVGSKREILCKSGEVTVIKSEEYVGEGLFSPDAVNGKCAFSEIFSKDEE